VGEGFLSGESLEASILFRAVVIFGVEQTSSPRDDTAWATSLPVQLAPQKPQKPAPPKKSPHIPEAAFLPVGTCAVRATTRLTPRIRAKVLRLRR
jgi:hypothetical protein